tara:strand:- start:996 stop:1169 length:174 start_codon:yes stop_codon:yes gene_type:complete
MGFPYNEASWNVVDGAMFMGWGGVTPFFYTLISIIICIVVLLWGDAIEKSKYEEAEK